VKSANIEKKIGVLCADVLFGASRKQGQSNAQFKDGDIISKRM
jgi:hypothetical protein